jgi:hypothetical protein
MMAESGGLPAWVEAWVGKVVQVHVHGDPDPLFGVQDPVYGLPRIRNRRGSRNSTSRYFGKEAFTRNTPTFFGWQHQWCYGPP